MRNLTILRKNAIPGSKKTVEVYVEDRENPTVTIEETPCRKVGTLQCGEQKTFSVPEEKTTVYVLDIGIEYILIGDKTQIPAGKNDLYLTGRVRYRKNAPFYFDGPATAQAPAYHPLAARRGLIVAIALTATLLAPLFLKMMPTPGHKNDGTLTSPLTSYTAEGVSIQLPDNFQQAESDKFTLTYTTRDVALFMLEEPFEGAEIRDFDSWTLEKYTSFVAEKNRIRPEQIKKNGEIPYYSYETIGSDGSKFAYYVFTYKTADAFWMLSFTVDAEDGALYEPAIMEWAKSVSFAE